MVYVVDLDDTLVLTKNLNNDAYNYALEKHGQKRIKITKRITREKLIKKPGKKLIDDKQKYFAQKWLKDNYPRYVITTDYLLQRRNGIKNVNLIDFISKNEKF